MMIRDFPSLSVWYYYYLQHVVFISEEKAVALTYQKWGHFQGSEQGLSVQAPFPSQKEAFWGWGSHAPLPWSLQIGSDTWLLCSLGQSLTFSLVSEHIYPVLFSSYQTFWSFSQSEWMEAHMLSPTFPTFLFILQLWYQVLHFLVVFTHLTIT